MPRARQHSPQRKSFPTATTSLPTLLSLPLKLSSLATAAPPLFQGEWREEIGAVVMMNRMIKNRKFIAGVRAGER